MEEEKKFFQDKREYRKISSGLSGFMLEEEEKHQGVTKCPRGPNLSKPRLIGKLSVFLLNISS